MFVTNYRMFEIRRWNGRKYNSFTHTHTHTHDDEEIIGRFSYKYGKILFNLIEIIIIYIVIINLFYLFMRWK